jgi:hypothetical protein
MRQDKSGRTLEGKFLYSVRRSELPRHLSMGGGWRRLRPSVDRWKCRRGIELRNHRQERRPCWLMGKAIRVTAQSRAVVSVPRSRRPVACMDVFCAEPGRSRPWTRECRPLRKAYAQTSETGALSLLQSRSEGRTSHRRCAERFRRPAASLGPKNRVATAPCRGSSSCARLVLVLASIAHVAVMRGIDHGRRRDADGDRIQ